MEKPTREFTRFSGVTTPDITIGIFSLILLYWLSTAAIEVFPHPLFDMLRVLLALPLVTIVPGALVIGLLGVRPRSVGRYVIYAVSSTVSLLSVVAVGASLFLPLLGVVRPLSVSVFGTLWTGLAFVLAVGAYLTETEFTVPLALPSGPFDVLVALTLLPGIAAVAAVTMNRYGNTIGMWTLFVCIAFVALVTTTRYVPHSFYGLTIFSVTLSTLLHKNLLTAWVVGADIQGLVATAEQVSRVGAWSPDVASVGIPIVTAVPSVISTLSGLGVHTTFKLVYVFVFALVPVGVYYLGRDAFGPEAGLYGAFLLSFYHVSFSFTPGKQLLSQLFVVTLLLTLIRGADRLSASVVAGLAMTGLVFSHYGSSYIYGLALLFASCVVTATRYWIDTYDQRLWVGYPVILLTGATLWYGTVSPVTLSLLASLPAVAVDQVGGLLAGRTPVGAGVSYVGTQTGLLEQANVALYLLVTVFIVVGVTDRCVTTALRLRDRSTPPALVTTALAVPLLTLLASSYVLSLNFWADRMYQLVLVVLAPFMPVGYRVLIDRAAPAFDRLTEHRPGPTWTPVALVLVVLLMFNAGVAFALFGTASTATFNADANDLTFANQERAGAVWLGVHGNVTELPPSETTAVSRVRAGDPDAVQIYMDPVSYHLFRSTLPPKYTTADVVLLKSRWRPELDPTRSRDGYVFLRRDAIRETTADQPLSPRSISERNARALASTRNLTYTNGEVDILETGNATG